MVTWFNPEAELLALAAASWGAHAAIQARIYDDMRRVHGWHLTPVE